MRAARTPVRGRPSRQHGRLGFLTGTSDEIRNVAKRYGIYSKNTPRDVDHTFLTSLVDQGGMLRVQYMGSRFDPDEMLRDLLGLLREGQVR